MPSKDEKRRKSDRWWYPSLDKLTLLIVTVAAILAWVNVHQTQNQQVEACERQNVSRSQTLRVYLTIAQGNRDRARAWLEIADLFPPTKDVALQQRRANLTEARDLIASVREITAAQAAVSQHPDSPDPVKQSIVDCEKAY